MKNTFGNNVSITLFGESHGPQIGAVLDGIAPGIEVDEAYIASQLALRRPVGKISTSRVEEDPFQIVSGVFEGHTTGTPICILIPNQNTKSKDYQATRYFARPGHADYTAEMKYHGWQDYRGGGHFSGRITAALVAAGAICLSALKQKGIEIGTHISYCGGIYDRDFEEYQTDIEALNQKQFAVLDEEAGRQMMSKIEEAARQSDSIGGKLETAVIGVPAGIGEPWFDSCESLLAHALFSIPAVKGVEFGMGFEMVNHLGSEVNDPFRMADSQVVTTTNNSGGINGGISNGMPIVFSCAIKPTPSIYQSQKTIDMQKKEDVDFTIQGRHDPAIFHRARVVVDSVSAIVLCDLLTTRYGTDYLKGE